jgi:6-pyruvoyltetrahydropterin/6-carboxytetrahydropterin synthase
VWSVTKRFSFDAAHRLLGYPGACVQLHGHTYSVEVTVEGESLDSLGMLVDFAAMREAVGSFIKSRWDHVTLLRWDDPLIAAINPCRFYPMEGNPTAENMAKELWGIIVDVWLNKLMNDEDKQRGLRLRNVRIYETPTSWTDYHG